MKETEEGITFFQKLYWESNGKILKYDVSIEKFIETTKNKKASYLEVLRKETKEPEIEVSLEPGKYRYKVYFYNALNQLAFETEWEVFEVRIAYEPEIRDVSPTIIYLEEKNDGIFTMKSRLIQKDSIVELESTTRKITYKPEEFDLNEDGTRIKLKFNINKVDVGTYKVKVTNPGGLQTKSEDIRIQFKKPMDLDISLGYAGVLILYDDTFSKYMNSNLWTTGAGAKISFMPFKHYWGYLGVGLSGTYTRMEAKMAGYTIDGNMETAHLNLVYQKIFGNRRFIFETFAGAGILMFTNFLFHFPHGIESEVLNSTNISADFGLGLQIYATKRIYAEITTQFVAAFISDMSYGMVVPRFSIGYQF